MQQVAAWAREWADSRCDIEFDAANCSPSYTRFTTSEMTEILPELKDSPSDWNTDTHYFYEIHVVSAKKVYVQLSINSKNITDEFRARCDEIQKYYPSKGDPQKWSYRLPFKTKPIVGEVIEKEQLHTYLDQCLAEINVFEKDLKQKLGQKAKE